MTDRRQEPEERDVFESVQFAYEQSGELTDVERSAKLRDIDPETADLNENEKSGK